MTDDRPFDFDDVFDDDYLFFYEPLLSDERSAREAVVVERLLRVPRGARVLDLACGHGRIANLLAQAGYEVTGLDATPLFLERARKDAAERGVSATYVEGDMRALPWSGEFDAVVNWFTAFGYWTDDVNRSVLREIQRALAPGGVLLMEHMNRDRVLRQFLPTSVTEREGRMMVDRNVYQADTGAIETERIVVDERGRRSFRFTCRVFTFPELAAWLTDAGFTAVEGFDEAGEPYTLDAMRMVVRAVKPA